jgi:hypothetical protein
MFCNGKTSCRLPIAVNPRSYGDPCPGTTKYLFVTYRCLSPPTKKIRKLPSTEKYCFRHVIFLLSLFEEYFSGTHRSFSYHKAENCQ